MKNFSTCLVSAATALLLVSATATEFGTVVATQLNTGNDSFAGANPSVALALGRGSSSGVIIKDGNRGDYSLDFGSGIDPQNGVLITSIFELTRNNNAQGSTMGDFFATSSFGPDAGGSDYYIAIHRSPQGDEVNINASFVYLPYNEWLGGIVRNSTNNGALGSIVGSTGLTLGSGATDPGNFTIFDSTENVGQYTLRLGSFTPQGASLPATSQNGILLVNGAKNEDNFALSRANADGSFTIFCHDNEADGDTHENDGIAFVYLPISAVGSDRLHAIGRVNGNASTDIAAGNFLVTKGGTGIWFLQIPGHTDASGTLVVTPAGGITNNRDNIVSHTWDATNHRWIIESRDLINNASPPVLEDMADAEEDVFSFAFFVVDPTNPPPTLSLSSPSNGSNFTVGEPIIYEVSANDDSAVSKVQFFAGGKLLGDDSIAPYHFTWNATAPGKYVLHATVTDDDGATTSSSPITIQVKPVSGTGGLYFDGEDDHVTFGDHPALKLSTFTLECWFKRELGGSGADTGTGGITAYPLITKGRGENDSSGVNCNYFLGIELASGKLAADFENRSNGLNHPVIGRSVVPIGVWQHAAVSFDGTAWRLYLNGSLEATVDTSGQLPENISTQHAGLGTAMNSKGVRQGYFHGFIDEVRIWNTARSDAELKSAINSQIPAATGLVARYAMNETQGNSIASSAGSVVNGSMVGGALRTSGAPFNLNIAPSISLAVPSNNATNVPINATLSAHVSDLDGGNLTVKFFGRPLGGVNDIRDFTIVALPDTQYYSENTGGNRASIFSAQTDWIVAEKDQLNIAAVLHLGDITEHGDNPSTARNEWTNASNAMYRLENPTTTLLSDGLPYVLAVGNHDQTPIGDANGTTTNFNTYFGVHPTTNVNHFAGKAYYGGTSIPSSADNNFILFTAGGIDFIVISLEYDTTQDVDDLEWADALLKAHPNRRGIVITHYLVGGGNPASFSPQGSAIYQALKDNPNLVLMHGGHIHNEGRREDKFEGRTVHSILADYQGRPNGGDGWLRIMKFRPSLNRIDVQTYSPTLDQYETDSNSQFSLNMDLSGGIGPFTEIGTVTLSSGTASVPWPDRALGGRYEWFATVSDGNVTETSSLHHFTVKGVVAPPSIMITNPQNGANFSSPANITISAQAADADGQISKVRFYSGTSLLGEVSSPPYQFEWQNVPVGSYTIIAKAIDDENLEAAAVPISVVVSPPPVEAQVPDVTKVSTGLFNPPTWTVTATSPAPYGFTQPGTSIGNIELKVNDTAAPFLGGITLASNWNNPANVGTTSADNISYAYANPSGFALINVIDNAHNNPSGVNPSTSKQSSGTAAAYFPLASGSTGAIVSAAGSILAGSLPTGVTVSKIGTGLYSVNGLSLAGNLMASPNGNTGVDADNVLSVRMANGAWIIDTRDNASTSQDSPFSFLYLPPATTGVLSGIVYAQNQDSIVRSPTLLNSTLQSLGGTFTAHQSYYEITFGDGSVINPSNTALFLTADSTISTAAVDNLLSYSSNGNAFRIFTQDLPELTGDFESIDFRFLAVPLNLLPPPPIPEVSVVATDASAGEYGADQSLAFTVSRTGDTTTALTVNYTTTGASAGRDFAILSGSIEIPAGAVSAVIPVTVLADEENEGEEMLNLSLVASTHYSSGAAISASGIIADRPLQAFLFTHNLGAANADPDGDGVENIIEYYMGSHGNIAASHATVTADTVNKDSFAASFPHKKSSTDVTATVEWSTDLAHWFTSGQSNGTHTATIALSTISAASEDPETIRALLTITSGATPRSVYLRLRVSP